MGLVNRVVRARAAARADARVRARARRQLLAGEHGDDEAQVYGDLERDLAEALAARRPS